MRDRFMKHVVADESGCWLWQSVIGKDGYGKFATSGTTKPLAHRIAYELFVGPIPEGLQIDHLCRVRRCVNPEHLEPVTQLENVRRGIWAQATHCKYGHPIR